MREDQSGKLLNGTFWVKKKVLEEMHPRYIEWTIPRSRRGAIRNEDIIYSIAWDSYSYTTSRTLPWLKPVKGTVVWEVISGIIQGYFPKQFLQKGRVRNEMLVR